MTTQAADSDTQTQSRVCRRCSTIAQAPGEFCPQCGARYTSRQRFSRRTRWIMLAGAFIALLAAGGATAAVVIHHEHVVTARKRALAARRATAKAAAARAQREAREQTQRISENEAKAAEQAEHREVVQRESLEHALETAITKEARERVGDVPGGTPEATVYKTECVHASGGSSQELNGSATGTFTCVAVTNEPPGSTYTGYGYTGTIDFQTGTYTWHAES